MTQKIKINLQKYEWLHDDGTTSESIRIYAGRGSIVIPFEQARRFVDRIHDYCDRRETEIRNEQT